MAKCCPVEIQRQKYEPKAAKAPSCAGLTRVSTPCGVFVDGRIKSGHDASGSRISCAESHILITVGYKLVFWFKLIFAFYVFRTIKSGMCLSKLHISVFSDFQV